MRWPNRESRFAKKLAYHSTWRLWFAWYPVEIDGKWIWLERVYRFGKLSNRLSSSCRYEDIYFIYKTPESLATK